MTRLILPNGAPAVGKSTLARRYAVDRPLALALDIDLVRRMLGGWQEDQAAAATLTDAEAELRAMHAKVTALAGRRPEAVVVVSVPGDVEATYRRLIAAIGA